MNQDLITLVKEEAAKLREYATHEERAKLNIEGLDGNSTRDCIYGQMANQCFSQRASELLKLCALPYSTEIYSETGEDLEWSRTMDSSRAWSAIEFFIYGHHSTPDQRAALVAYLKGETETLEL